MDVGSINAWKNQTAQVADGGKVDTQQVESSNNSASQKTENSNSNKDSVVISAEGQEKAKRSKTIEDLIEQIRAEHQEMIRQLERMQKQDNAGKSDMDKKVKCMKIAMRIIRGDNVPKEDYRFLAENDMELYAKAIMLRMKREDPEDCERLSEDEESGYSIRIRSSTEEVTKTEGSIE